MSKKVTPKFVFGENVKVIKGFYKHLEGTLSECYRSDKTITYYINPTNNQKVRTAEVYEDEIVSLDRQQEKKLKKYSKKLNKIVNE